MMVQSAWRAIRRWCGLALLCLLALIPVAHGQAADQRDLAFDPKAPDWSVKDAATQSLRFTAYRTNPSTWSAEGGYGLRWGMGPGDVARAVPELRHVFGHSPDLQVSSFTQEVQGRQATVFMRFFRGRLYEVSLSSFVSASSPNFSYDDIVRARQTGWQWREKIRKIVGDAYGAPVCAPTPRTRINLCDNGDGQGGCSGGATPEQREKWLRWVWRTAETEVTIAGVGVYTVTYKDLLMQAVVQQAEALHRAAFARQQERKEALERERLGGVPSGVNAPAADAPLRMDFSIPPLQCWSDPGASVDDRTPPTSWSAMGWDGLRWGMGPGDVKAVLGANEPMTWTLGNQYIPDRLSPDNGWVLRGVRGAVVFEFVKGRLSNFMFMPTCDLANTRGTGCAAALAQVKNQLIKSWGAPTCNPSDEHTAQEVCMWDTSPKGWVESTHHGPTFMLKFVFSDPQGRAFRYKPDRQAGTVAPKDWYVQGWGDFRWGMGVTDVSQVLADRARPYQRTQALSCFRREHATSFSCTLAAAAHQFRVLGHAPELEFEFADQHLTQIRLEFRRGIPREQFWATGEKMRDAMVARYGKPHDHYDETTQMRSLIERWEGADFEGSLYVLDSLSSPSITVVYRLPKRSATRARATAQGL